MTELIKDQFMQNAILATLCAGTTCALIGVLVVTMRLSLIGVCMSHSAFAGALLGLVVGWNPLVTAMLLSLLAATALGPIADRGDFEPDTAMGIVFSSSLGLAFLLLALVPGPKSQALSLLWGSVLTVTRLNLIVMAAVTFVVIAALVLFYKEVQSVIFSRELAIACGVPATAVFYSLLVASGLAITTSLSAIGGLLVFSLIINPAAAAYQLSYNLKKMFLLAVIFGVLSGWIGLALSCVFNLPTGALIIVVSSLIFVVATILCPKRKTFVPKDLLGSEHGDE